MTTENNKSIERVLVLSGGGGRGAYQVGACKVILNELDKDKGGWWPDMVLGNSIGATNGAILFSADTDNTKPNEIIKRLETIWTDRIPHYMKKVGDEDKFHCASDEWPKPVRKLLQWVIGKLQKKNNPNFSTAIAEENHLSGEITTQGLDALLEKHAIMSRPGWKKILEECDNEFKFNWKVTSTGSYPKPYFGIAATKVHTGELTMFWNETPPGQPRIKGIEEGINIAKVMASSSIPGVYEATVIDGQCYWDGALVANTPIAPAIDLGAKDIIVVLMAPWWFQEMFDPSQESAGSPPAIKKPEILDSVDRFLDWMMLAPLRTELRWLKKQKPEVKIRIIAPESLQGMVSIIDYDYDKSDIIKVIDAGADRARKVLGIKEPSAS